MAHSQSDLGIACIADGRTNDKPYRSGMASRTENEKRNNKCDRVTDRLSDSYPHRSGLVTFHCWIRYL